MDHRTTIQQYHSVPPPSPIPPTPSSPPVYMEGTEPKEAKEEPNQEDAKDEKDAIKEAKEEKEKFIDKAMLKVAILMVAISSAALLTSNMVIPNESRLKIFYRVNIFFTWATFSSGLACVALCSVLHKPADKNLPVTKCVMWAGLVLLELSMVLGAFLKMFL